MVDVGNVVTFEQMLGWLVYATIIAVAGWFVKSILINNLEVVINKLFGKTDADKEQIKVDMESTIKKYMEPLYKKAALDAKNAIENPYVNEIDTKEYTSMLKDFGFELKENIGLEPIIDLIENTIGLDIPENIEEGLKQGVNDLLDNDKGNITEPVIAEDVITRG